jgi:pimeloyl-ACP methyl ester carboxylesterase
MDTKTKVAALLMGFASIASAQYPLGPQEYYFDTALDHFNNGGFLKTFKMRYIVDAQYWDPSTGPILFYAGNEGDIEGFYKNSGFMTTNAAAELNALVVYGEHRYFGKSFPFDKAEAFTPENNVYLTIEQTMMDYVELVKHIRYRFGATDKPCFVFGGSYGGMLAAWIRMKHPATFQGAYASSAPILYFKDAPTAPENAFNDIITADFAA